MMTKYQARKSIERIVKGGIRGCDDPEGFISEVALSCAATANYWDTTKTGKGWNDFDALVVAMAPNTKQGLLRAARKVRRTYGAVRLLKRMFVYPEIRRTDGQAEMIERVNKMAEVLR